MKTAAIAILVGVGTFLAIMALPISGSRESPADRIARGCEREFGGQGVLVDRCKIQLMSEELLKHQQNMLDRARR